MQFTINLATKTYINQKKLTLVISACIIVLLFFLFINIRIFAFNAGEITRLSNADAALEAKHKIPGRAVSEKEYTELLASVKQANGIIERKAFNWIGLLDNLENVVPEGVAFSAVEPNVKERTLKLSGVAANFKNLQNLMENLERSSYFSNVFLLNQNVFSAAENQKGISFNITCKFVS
jgi:type IV pilus assembly protein PilN